MAIAIHLPAKTPPRPKPKYLWKIATLAPEGSAYLAQWKEIRREIEEKTDGLITSKLYAGGAMGDDPDVVRKLRLGQLDAIAVTSLGAKLLVPEIAVFELPFLFEDWDEAKTVRDRLRPYFERLFDERGLVLVDWFHQGFIDICSKEPIRDPETLARNKVWAWSGEEVAIATLEALGVQPVTTTIPEVLTALRTNLVTVIPAASLALLALQWFSEIDYITPLSMRYEMGVIVVNKKSWNEVDPEILSVIEETFRRHRGEISDQLRRDNELALEEMFKRGIKKVELTAEEREVFVHRTRPVWEKFIGKLYPRSLLNKVLHEREIYRKERGSKS